MYKRNIIEKELYLRGSGWVVNTINRNRWIRKEWQDEPKTLGLTPHLCPNWNRSETVVDAYEMAIKDDVPNTIHVLKKIWVDPYENVVGNALGYKPIGFLYSKELAEEICRKGKEYTKKYCWAIRGKVKEYKTEEIKLYDGEV